MYDVHTAKLKLHNFWNCNYMYFIASQNSKSLYQIRNMSDQVDNGLAATVVTMSHIIQHLPVAPVLQFVCLGDCQVSIFAAFGLLSYISAQNTNA